METKYQFNRDDFLDEISKKWEHGKECFFEITYEIARARNTSSIVLYVSATSYFTSLKATCQAFINIPGCQDESVDFLKSELSISDFSSDDLSIKIQFYPHYYKAVDQYLKNCCEKGLMLPLLNQRKNY